LSSAAERGDCYATMSACSQNRVICFWDVGPIFMYCLAHMATQGE